MGQYVKAGAAAEMSPGQGKLVELQGKKIALFNVDGAFYAIDDTCTHRGGPLSEGECEGTEVTCPWHGAIFDLRTGEVIGGPAKTKVACYPVRVSGADVEIEV
ncbi:MAG: non-heme iron oxygenase ferredoxin subunit [Deltaproteobacteria bacterium]|nr:non-heme iron oxygenase ferredoxin subunit [Deltaproteobacteria bacterium]